MIDLSSLFDKATEFFNGSPAADLAESNGAIQWLENIGIDPADLNDLSAVDTDSLLANLGVDGESPISEQALDAVRMKLTGE